MTMQELAFHLFGIFIALAFVVRIFPRLNDKVLKVRAIALLLVLLNFGSASILLATIMRAGGYPIVQ